MKFRYSAFGLQLRSSQAIPGLLPIRNSSTQADVVIQLTGPNRAKATDDPGQLQLFYRSPHVDSEGRAVLTVFRSPRLGSFRLVYSDETTFTVDRSGSRIEGRWSEPMTLEDTATYLLGPVFGFVLRLRGFTCLHASAVAIDGQAVVLLGASGAGKSTAAAWFARNGYAVLSDDVVALARCGNHYLVQPGYPRLRLWASSVEALFGKSDVLPLLTPNWDKYYLDLSEGEYRFAGKALPLAAIYALQERSADGNAPLLAEMAPREALITLVTHSYGNYLLDETMRSEEFHCLSQALGRVQLRRVTPHAEAARLPGMCRLITADFRRRRALAPA